MKTMIVGLLDQAVWGETGGLLIVFSGKKKSDDFEPSGS